jgi:hypothetical protein
LSASSLTLLGIDQADAALKQIGSFLGADHDLPNTDELRGLASQDSHDEKAIRAAILALHGDLLVKLTAADFSLGKSYGLGRALADTCAPARGTPAQHRESIKAHLEPHRALVLVGWLDDLRTTLPDHAGHAVADSLERWVRWAGKELDRLDDAGMEEATHHLHRQGQRWRAILSGEKACKDLLGIEGYIIAAQGVLRRIGQIAHSLVGQLKLPMLVAALLLGVGIALMFISNSTGQALAGLGAVGGALGITWKSAASSLGGLGLRLGEPLWGAQLDGVIADSVTPVPQREFREPATPPVASPAAARPTGRSRLTIRRRHRQHDGTTPSDEQSTQVRRRGLRQRIRRK